MGRGLGIGSDVGYEFRFWNRLWLWVQVKVVWVQELDMGSLWLWVQWLGMVKGAWYG